MTQSREDYHSELLKEWRSRHNGRHAVLIEDNSFYFPECHKSFSTDKETDIYYCDEHAPSYFADYYAPLKVDQAVWICKRCQQNLK